ncbi:hypothetical protein AWZ03_002895 [Drosophila navojoa]|uniref:Protein phosphatase 1 regulatory subunit 36 n=1 Tax=Drosophila navojoa TaxID=7232 RepID=A0A484BS47_DRONA|nr:hypothetical protein AWZ03_002895 [Drosophila navojoa]
MNRIHIERSLPKYRVGKWKWNEKSEELNFRVYTDLEDRPTRFIYTNGYKFIRTINQDEESVLREQFVRSDNTFDADTVIIDDVRNLVLFLMPKEFLNMQFLEFMHHPLVHRLLHGLIIYFEYFLRFVELILVQRDELSDTYQQIKSHNSTKIKRIWSKYLSQYRILVARDYTELITGDGDLNQFYHLRSKLNISATKSDGILYDQFLAVATQIVWISLHRRAYFVIEMEINRLFRSEHFYAKRPEYPRFTPAERSLLYGRYNKIVNYRNQTSPLMQEMQNISTADVPIVLIGRRKYPGTDPRILELELEYIVPGSQLRLIDVQHGILGHPKAVYDTLLRLNWAALRQSTHSWIADKQPYLRIPNIENIEEHKSSEELKYRYNIFFKHEPTNRETLAKWMQREKLLEYYNKHETVKSVHDEAKTRLAFEEERSPVDKIVSSYMDIISKLRQNKR